MTDDERRLLMDVWEKLNAYRMIVVSTVGHEYFGAVPYVNLERRVKDALGRAELERTP